MNKRNCNHKYESFFFFFVRVYSKTMFKDDIDMYKYINISNIVNISQHKYM